MSNALGLTLGSLPLSAWVVTGDRTKGPLLLFLYIAVLGCALAQVCGPGPDWAPCADSIG